jgi:dTDP-4-amino-4,6-dideoxygalactose transaminase
MEETHLKDAIARAARSSGGPVKAVFPVLLAGQCADPRGLRRVAGENGLQVVEDAAHAIGSRYYGEANSDRPVGDARQATMTAFSFHPVKTIAMGEGGAVTTNDDSLAESLRRLRSHGMLREAGELSNRDLAFDETGAVNPWYYEMPKVGLNYRVTDIQCALGLSQIRKLDRFVARRRALAALYDDLLADLAPLVRPITKSPAGRAAWHLYAVLIDFEAAGLSRARLVERLMAVGVGTQVHYIPVHLQPYYRGRYGAVKLPGAERYYARTLSLPLFPAMRDADVERVVDALTQALRQT